MYLNGPYLFGVTWAEWNFDFRPRCAAGATRPDFFVSAESRRFEVARS